MGTLQHSNQHSHSNLVHYNYNKAISFTFFEMAPVAMRNATARPMRAAKTSRVARASKPVRAAVAASACMLVWKPTRKYETFSYLPDLTDDEIKKRVAYMLRKGLTPCLEFDSAERSFAAENPAYGPGFYYNRYDDVEAPNVRMHRR